MFLLLLIKINIFFRFFIELVFDKLVYFNVLNINIVQRKEVERNKMVKYCVFINSIENRSLSNQWTVPQLPIMFIYTRAWSVDKGYDCHLTI